MNWDIKISVFAAILADILESCICKLFATKRVRFPDLGIIEIDFLFVFLADLWAEIYKYLFSGFFIHHLGKLHLFPGYRHYKRSISWPWYYINWLFIRLCSWPMTWDIQISVSAPFWPPSWKIVFGSYCHYEGSIPWPWYYGNRLLICVSSWPMTWDITQSVGVNNYPRFVFRVPWNSFVLRLLRFV